MVKIASPELRNKTHVPFTTRWTSVGIDTPIIVEPFTPMNEIIPKLVEAKNQEFTPWQVVDMKHYYHKFKETDNDVLRAA